MNTLAKELTVVCVSDLHGVSWPEIPPCDLLLIAGDNDNAYLDPHDLIGQIKYIRGPFSRWLDAVPAKHKVIIGGNHDFLAKAHPEIYRDLNCYYLEDKAVEIEGLVVYGSPWTPVFGMWTFMLSEEQLKQKWAQIPKDCNILLTHCPPYGIADALNRSLQPGEDTHAGSESLHKIVEELSDLRLHVFGHIHEGRGEGEYKSGAKWVNATSIDPEYRPVYQPIVTKIKL